MTNNDKINEEAQNCCDWLGGYSQRDAVSILAAAISIIASQPEQAGQRLDEPFIASNRNLLRRRPGHISRVEKDPEIKTFIHNLDRYYTGQKILAMIEERFGKERTPSKSSLGRYLQKITDTNSQAKERNK